MISETESTQAEILEEYRSLQGQLQKYYEQRQAILGLVVTAVGGLMAFGSRANGYAVSISLYTIVIIGGMLTHQCNFQIIRRMSYINVFIENYSRGLKWCTRSGRMSALVSGQAMKIGRFSIPRGFLPDEYPCAYFGLAVIISAYSSFIMSEYKLFLCAIVAIGWAFIVPTCLTIQRSTSKKSYDNFITIWTSVQNNEINDVAS